MNIKALNLSAGRSLPTRRISGVVAGTALATVLLLGACASLSPQARSAYDQAQSEVQQFEADPLANQAAGDPLQQARADLANADNAAKHDDASSVMYWSYLARRQAEIGLAMIAEVRARNQVADATAERDRLLLDYQHQQAALAQTRANDAEQRAQAAEQQVQQLRQEQQQQATQQEIAQAQQQAQQEAQQAQQAAQQQVAQAKAEEDAAKQQLEDLQAKETARGMVLTLGGSLLFATGRDTLEPGGIQSLDRIAAFLQQHPMMKIRIEGFTDDRGSDALNDALSQRRADAVVKALEADGIDPSRLEGIGRGKSLPVASNDTSAGRQQNRRVELLFSDTEGRFASEQPGQALR